MTQENQTKQKPQTTIEVVEYFDLNKRPADRLKAAITDDVVSKLSWTTLRSLAFACRDPKTSAKGITLSQKVMMYRKYDKLWESISEAVKVYGSNINDVKCQPEIGEDVASFRTRYLQAVLGLTK
jgi:hypothetical protein